MKSVCSGFPCIMEPMTLAGAHPQLMSSGFLLLHRPHEPIETLSSYLANEKPTLILSYLTLLLIT